MAIATEKRTLSSYAQGGHRTAAGGFVELPSAVDGHVVARASSDGLDFGRMARYARKSAARNCARSPSTSARRCSKISRLSQQRKDPLYELSFETGATSADHFFDIDGGIGTLFSYASKGGANAGRDVFVEGDVEPFGKTDVRAAGTSSRRCKASRSTSTRTTFRAGACSKSSRRHCSRACPRS